MNADIPLAPTAAVDTNAYRERVTPFTYLGLLLITLANLMYENILTRVFSVTMNYNFAFMAVSIALFGMTVGSVIVYLGGKRFAIENVKKHLAVHSCLFAISIVVTFYFHAQVPFSFSSTSGLLLLVLNFLLISVPFIFCGIVVCLALTKIPHQVSKLYAADLVGAALGCILMIVTLNQVDGPTAVVIIALLSAAGALLFAFDTRQFRLVLFTFTIMSLLVLLAAAQLILNDAGTAPLRLKWVKGKIEPPLLYEKWNSYSRVRIWSDPQQGRVPFGWGLSSKALKLAPPQQLSLDIDASASTVITEFNGNLSTVDYLKYDVTNLVHYIRPEANVLVIGSGGGRDILSALVFHQKSVTGVEINENIVNVVNGQYGKFTGHLDQRPDVTFKIDEARSFITRSPDRYDVIQLSLIDTWAATTSGAYVFTESSLYTTDAWKIFLDHLTPDGVITYSRWYYQSMPNEIYRLTALASQSLSEAGIKNVRDHIILVRYLPDSQTTSLVNGAGVGTILVSKAPFTQENIQTVHMLAKEMGFDVVLSPQDVFDPVFLALTRQEGFQEYLKNFPVDITPPTDDRPFFFHMLRLKDIFHMDLWEKSGLASNVIAVYTLAILLVTVVLLTVTFILVPILLTTRRVNTRKLPPFLLYFSAIGFGFMLVEISQVQRLTIFLGHPTYSLSTVLFSLLLSSGIGSFLTESVSPLKLKKPATILFMVLLGMLILFGLITPQVTHAFAGSSNALRIVLSVTLLTPLGLFMGMAFPLGMKAASTEAFDAAPWLWGVNGAASVCASVIAIAVAMTFSISAAYWTGFACYALAALSFAWILFQARKALPKTAS